MLPFKVLAITGNVKLLWKVVAVQSLGHHWLCEAVNLFPCGCGDFRKLVAIHVQIYCDADTYIKEGIYGAFSSSFSSLLSRVSGRRLHITRYPVFNWRSQELNPGHSACEAKALSNSLHMHMVPFCVNRVSCINRSSSTR